MKIIADENIPMVKAAFSSLGQVVTMPGRLIKQASLKDCDILLVRSVTQVRRQLLENTPIKFIASATSGIDHIDLNYLVANNIGFAHALGSNANAVAEYVMSAVAHWSIFRNKKLSELSIGIIGCGQVGSRVKKLCQQLDLRTIINDPPLAQHNEQAHWSTLEAALDCDVISLHTPLTCTGKHATKNLINQGLIQQIQPGTLLVNTARGEVLDETALLSRQINHHDLDLVLDVWQNEPNISPQMLKHTLLGTPHIAGYSFDAKMRGTAIIYEACCQFLKVQTQWSEACSADHSDQAVIDSFNNAADIRTSILDAYDIKADNDRFKLLLENQQTPIGSYFDLLRKKYPKRREWSHLFNPLLS